MNFKQKGYGKITRLFFTVLIMIGSVLVQSNGAAASNSTDYSVTSQGDIIYVTGPGGLIEDIIVSLINLITGEIIIFESQTNGQIDLSGLPDGNYEMIIEIPGQEGACMPIGVQVSQGQIILSSNALVYN